MPDTWNSDRYRTFAAKWRKDAEALPPGRERDECFALADKYADLVAIIDRLPENSDAPPVFGASPS